MLEESVLIYAGCDEIRPALMRPHRSRTGHPGGSGAPLAEFGLENGGGRERIMKGHALCVLKEVF